MYRSNRQVNLNISQYIYDIACIIISYYIAYYVAKRLTTLYDIHFYMWILIVDIPIWVFTMSDLGMYDTTTFKYKDRLLKNILFSSLVAGIIVAAMIFFIKETLFSRIMYASFMIISVTILVIERFLLTYYIQRHGSNGYKKIIIVGEEKIAEKFIYYLDKTNLKIKVVEYIPVSKVKEVLDLKDKVVDEIIFAVSKEYLSMVEEYALDCEEMGISVSMVLELYDFKVAKTCLTSIGTLPMLTFHTVSFNKLQLSIKRFIDIIGALSGLFITAVISVFIIPAIKLDSPGPILFSQDRVGVNGRIFKLYKFRSMTVDAESMKKQLLSYNEVNSELMFKIKNDPRITKVGKFLRTTSLDEFPQFINVLKGEMSLVGTRPPTIEEVNKYEKHHRRRISIKPGITGMWQVHGRSQITDFNEVVKLDTQYIDNWSVFLDIKIIFQTFMVLITRKGAM